MKKKDRRILGLIAGSFSGGLLLLVLAETWQTPEISHWLAIPHHLVRETGFALIVSSVIATIFELFLSGARDRRIMKHIGDYERMHQFGFRSIFVDRQNVFDDLIARLLPAADRVQIIGICVSIFREFERQNKRPSAESPIDFFAKQILRGQRIEVLMLKRDPSAADLARYGLNTGDFYRMREWDEDKPDSFSGGRRLRKIANQAVGQFIEVLVRVAEQSSEESEANRRETVGRLNLKEYVAMPSVSLYIIDEEIFVTPYLYRRHCSSVPAFSVAGRTTPLYREYLAHFTEAWKSDLTSWVVPQEFVDALIQDPHGTANEYRQALAKIRTTNLSRLSKDLAFVEDPENFRAEERAMLSLVNTVPSRAGERDLP